MNRNFAAVVLGGTGQVGGAAVAELLAMLECRRSGDGHQKAHSPLDRGCATSFSIPPLRTLPSALLPLPAKF